MRDRLTAEAAVLIAVLLDRHPLRRLPRGVGSPYTARARTRAADRAALFVRFDAELLPAVRVLADACAPTLPGPDAALDALCQQLRDEAGQRDRDGRRANWSWLATRTKAQARHLCARLLNAQPPAVMLDALEQAQASRGDQTLRDARVRWQAAGREPQLDVRQWRLLMTDTLRNLPGAFTAQIDAAGVTGIRAALAGHVAKL